MPACRIQEPYRYMCLPPLALEAPPRCSFPLCEPHDDTQQRAENSDNNNSEQKIANDNNTTATTTTKTKTKHKITTKYNDDAAPSPPPFPPDLNSPIERGGKGGSVPQQSLVRLPALLQILLLFLRQAAVGEAILLHLLLQTPQLLVAPLQVRAKRVENAVHHRPGFCSVIFRMYRPGSRGELPRAVTISAHDAVDSRCLTQPLTMLLLY